jgi:hypothetical protein
LHSVGKSALSARQSRFVLFACWTLFHQQADPLVRFLQPGTQSIRVRHPRRCRFWAAVTTLIARSFPGPVPVCPTRAMAACAFEWIVRSPGISLSMTYSIMLAIASLLRQMPFQIPPDIPYCTPPLPVCADNYIHQVTIQMLHKYDVNRPYIHGSLRYDFRDDQ